MTVAELTELLGAKVLNAGVDLSRHEEAGRMPGPLLRAELKDGGFLDITNLYVGLV